MISTMTGLLADCYRYGIQLSLTEGGGLTIDAPEDVLTPELLARLKAHKVDLLATLRPTTELGRCVDCSQELTESLSFDGFFNLVCRTCDRCFGCRPATTEIAARFAGPGRDTYPENAILELWALAADDWFADF
jgi:hypothetical protein